MSNTHTNQSWREQRKPILMTSVATGQTTEFISIWQASHVMAERFGCKPSTAKKEIKRSISTGHARYGATWSSHPLP